MRSNHKFGWIGIVTLFLSFSRVASAGPLSEQDYVAGHSKIAVDLDTSKTAPIDVIVQFTAVPTQHHVNKVVARGGMLKARFDHIKGGLFSVPANALEQLSRDPEVAYISPDRPLRSSGTGNSSIPLDYHPAAVNASYGWNLGLNGNGIGIALIDSGVDTMSDLPTLAIAYSQGFGGASTTDQYGHGTHVAGILAGNGSKSTGYGYSYTFLGIAQGASLINLAALNGQGQGTDSAVISAIQEAISLKSKYNIRVINLSLGRPVYESYTLDPLCQAVESAWKAGIVVVVAAGNDGRDNSFGTDGYLTIDAPANDPYVITVGAMNTKGTASRSDDVIASYSSKGPTPLDQLAKPDLVAPGNRIISLYESGSYLSTNYPANEIPYSLYMTGGSTTASTTYYCLSGTSMATPVVSGAVALMLQQHPTMTPDQVKARLMKTAYKSLPPYSTATDPTTGITYSDQSDIFTVGAGYLDIQAALSNTDLATSTVGSAMSPPVIYSTSNGTTTVSLNTANSIMWGKSSTWADTVVWGTNVLVNSNAALWGSSTVVWGASTNSAFSVVWGKSVVWGASSGESDDSESTTVAIYGED